MCLTSNYILDSSVNNSTCQLMVYTNVCYHVLSLVIPCDDVRHSQVILEKSYPGKAWPRGLWDHQ